MVIDTLDIFMSTFLQTATTPSGCQSWDNTGGDISAWKA